MTNSTMGLKRQRISRGSADRGRGEDRYLTGELGHALELANGETVKLPVIRQALKRNVHAGGYRPLLGDTKMATLGASLAGDIRPPVVWPDFKAIEANRPPPPSMSEETRARLREARAHNPKDAGDATAQALRGLNLDEVYALGAKALGESEKVLRAKYGHLNPGQQRMNIGNRMRALAKKAEGGKTVAAVTPKVVRKKATGIRARALPKLKKLRGKK